MSESFFSFLRRKVFPTFQFLVISAIIFLALMQLSLQFIFAYSGGFFNRWEQLPSPPATPIGILPHYSLRIRGVDQQIYGLEIFSPDREERTQWFLESESALENVFPVMSDCVTEELPGSLLSPPPINITDCQNLNYGPEAGISYVVLDKQHQLWARIITMTTSGGLILLVLFALVAFILSPIISLSLMRAGRRLFSTRSKA